MRTNTIIVASNTMVAVKMCSLLKMGWMSFQNEFCGDNSWLVVDELMS